MPRSFALALLVLLAACDTVPVGITEGRYRTEGTDYPNAAILASDGGVIVGALVEGTIAPTDGTIGHPAVVRFQGGEARAAVYRADERTYSGVQGVAELDGGLAVAVGRTEEATVYRADRDGDLDGVLFRLEDGASFTQDALTRTSAGLVVSVYPYRAGDPQLYGVSSTGGLQWTYRMAGAQDVWDVSASGDHLYALGSSTEGAGVVLARLTPNGAEVWRRTLPGSYGADIAAAGDGVVVLYRTITEDGERTGVTRFDADGEVLWQQTVGSDLDANVVIGAVLADGRVAIGTSAFDDGRFEGGTRTEVVVLSPDGAVRQRLPINEPWEDTTFVRSLLVRPDGALVAVLAVGPRRLGGYGGDDFDIEVRTLEIGG